MEYMQFVLKVAVFMWVSTVAVIMESLFQIQGSLCGISNERSGSGADFNPGGLYVCSPIHCSVSAPYPCFWSDSYD